jgi:hypothetical protein
LPRRFQFATHCQKSLTPGKSDRTTSQGFSDNLDDRSQSDIAYCMALSTI